MKTIGEILTGRALISVPGSTNVLEVARRMGEARVGAMLIADEGGMPRGVFTERDLMLRVIVAGKDPAKVAVEEVMTRELFTTSPDRRINDVWREMHARHIRHVPVVVDGRVIGMLSLRDLLHEHLDVKRGEVQALTAYIQGEGEAPPAPG